jgi:hypothetical protein
MDFGFSLLTVGFSLSASRCQLKAAGRAHFLIIFALIL